MTVMERSLSAPGTLNMTVDYASLQQRIAQLQQFVRDYMVPGEDYGTIEGVNKPTLLKSGAEKLCDVYGLAVGEPRIEYTRDDTKTPVYYAYRVTLPLISRADGRIIMHGVGSCNSHEKKYKYRWVFANELPPGINQQSLKTKQVGSQKQYTQYQIPNDEIDDLDNTILKMAKKRALVDAVLSATRSSAIFTQDVEDMDIKTPDQTARYEQRQERASQNQQNNNRSNNSAVSSMQGKSSEAQQNAILKIGRSKGLNDQEISAIVNQQCGSDLKDLSKQDASNMIQLLQNKSPEELRGLIGIAPFAEETVNISDDDLPF
jgi:hypothetical protein